MSNSKVKSFSLAGGKKNPLVKEKFKVDEDAKAAAEVYEEFVSTFEAPAKSTGKAFVRGSVINPGSGEEHVTKESGRLYKPARLAQLEAKATENARNSSNQMSQQKPDKPGKKKVQDKKKTNLELFKEELKIIQEERDERKRLKRLARQEGGDDSSSSSSAPTPANRLRAEVYERSSLRLSEDVVVPSKYDSNDPTTTNIYLGNIPTTMTEPELCEMFGRYGPLASIKIMWPRSDDERARGRNCGFVAFMSRKDGERAMAALQGTDFRGMEMKMGWGKAVPIPPYPVYIPKLMMELTMPPPPSNLPFNTQVKDLVEKPADYHQIPPQELDQMIRRGMVKVVVPTERTLLSIIHRVIEFVVREGPMFEAMIMNREMNNPMFRFLFDNQSPAHCYYRWRLFSILNGDHPTKWRNKPFRMFKGGSWWRPPPNHSFTSGLTDEMIRIIEQKEKEKEKEAANNSNSAHGGGSGSGQTKSSSSSHKEDPKKGSLSERQRNRLEDMLRQITPEKHRIQDAMVWCIDHADAAEEIVDCLSESLQIDHTPLFKKIARLYLLSDILHNCCVKVSNASFYRKAFQAVLPDIIGSLHRTYESIESRLRAEQFKNRVCQCFRAWDSWAVYPNDFLINLQNVFLGLLNQRDTKGVAEEEPESDIDGVPLEDAKTSASASAAANMKVFDDDIDGVPIDDVDGIPMDQGSGAERESSSAAGAAVAKFKVSKWETVDPEVVQQQAVTTSKWERIEDEYDDDLDGKPLDEDGSDGSDSRVVAPSKLAASRQLLATSATNSPRNPEAPSGAELPNKAEEERRQKLRELEVKVMKFQDDLESGRRPRIPGETIVAQVEAYRKKQHRKMFPDDSPSNEGRQSSKRHRNNRSSSSSPSPSRTASSRRSTRRSSRSPPRRSKRSASPPSNSRSSRRSPPSSRSRRSPPSPPSSRARRSSPSPPPARSSSRRSSPSPPARSSRASPSSSRSRRSPSPLPPSSSSSKRAKTMFSPSPTRSRQVVSNLIASGYGGSSASDSGDDDYSAKKRITSPLRLERRRSRSPRKSKHQRSPSPSRKRRRH